ncbi:TolC family outer membrane protein [Candidatus Pelagibacter sp.]|nr:TolC family outer membrane protein [Candidatus Pelagibacter sp.]
MRKVFIFYLVIFILDNNSFAENLPEALLKAYKNNPILNAERENISISKENLNISKSEFLPTITITGTKSKEDTTKLTNQNGSDASINNVNPLTKSLLIEQTLYDGKARNADLEKSKIGIDLAKIKTLKIEQEILYKAIEAYSGLIFANKKLMINQSNVNLLKRQVETDQARLETGKITISDLAQSESSLAGAKANFIEAKNNVVTSILIYENIIGVIKNPNKLNNNFNLNYVIPKNLNQAIEISKEENPNLIIAKLEYQQSKKDVQISKSQNLPSASLSFEASQIENLSTTYDERDKKTIKATLKWPFYTGGKNKAKIDKNISIKNQKRLLLESAIKTSNTNVASAWSSFQSSKSLLDSVKAQVKAAEIANEGITVEYESGLGRSTLDIIQSNALLLNSKISLANSERNYLLSQFKLLQSVGLLTLEYLKIS